MSRRAWNFCPVLVGWVGRVEPRDPPRPRPGAGFGGSWLLVDKLVVVAGLVQGLLVWIDHGQELLLALYFL